MACRQTTKKGRGTSGKEKNSCLYPIVHRHLPDLPTTCSLAKENPEKNLQGLILYIMYTVHSSLPSVSGLQLRRPLARAQVDHVQMPRSFYPHFQIAEASDATNGIFGANVFVPLKWTEASPRQHHLRPKDEPGSGSHKSTCTKNREVHYLVDVNVTVYFTIIVVVLLLAALPSHYSDSSG